MKSILDRSFRYTPSGATDIRKTFQRVRKEQAQQQERQRQQNVAPMRRTVGK